MLHLTTCHGRMMPLLTELVSYFSHKTGCDIPLETICMECQVLFTGKNKITNLSSAE